MSSCIYAPSGGSLAFPSSSWITQIATQYSEGSRQQYSKDLRRRKIDLKKPFQSCYRNAEVVLDHRWRTFQKSSIKWGVHREIKYQQVFLDFSATQFLKGWGQGQTRKQFSTWCVQLTLPFRAFSSLHEYSMKKVILTNKEQPFIPWAGPSE